MKKIFLLLIANSVFFNIALGQSYKFIPEGLRPISTEELIQRGRPEKVDIVYYSDGTPTTFEAVLKEVHSGELVPEAFVDQNGILMALVVKKVDIKIDYPNIPDDIKNLGFSVGNIESDTIIIHSQGGPSFSLDTWKFAKLKDKVGNYLWINVMQSIMINPDPFKNRILTFDELKNYVDESTEILYRVVNYFKSQNKKVFLIGGSGGGFQITHLLASYGNLADGYVITTARLDMNDEMWKPRLKGEQTLFKNDGKTIYKGRQPPTVLDKNINMFQAVGASREFIKELEGTDLSNVIYLYGKIDSAVGTLIKHEIEFLRTHGAIVIASNRGHEIYQDYIEVLLRLLLLD